MMGLFIAAFGTIRRPGRTKKFLTPGVILARQHSGLRRSSATHTPNENDSCWMADASMADFFEHNAGFHQ